MSSKIFNMLLLFLFEIDVVAHILRHALLGRSRGFVHLHLAFALLARLLCKGRAETAESLRSGLLSEAFAELLLHLLADLVDPPAESQHQHDDQNNKSHKKIQDKQRDALEQRGGAERQYDDKERRQRIALHEAHQGVDDCQYEIHSDFGLHLHKGMENYAYFN